MKFLNDLKSTIIKIIKKTETNGKSSSKLEKQKSILKFLVTKSSRNCSWFLLSEKVEVKEN